MRARLLPLLLALAIPLSACGAEDAAQEARDAIDPVAQAATKTAKAGGIQMRFLGSVDGVGLPDQIPIRGSGVVDSAARKGRLSFRMELPGGLGDTKVEQIIDGLVIYMKMDQLSRLIPGGKEWLKIDLAKAAKSQGLNLEQLMQLGSGSTDPAAVLDYLKGAGSAKRVGNEKVNGVQTTRYDVQVDLRKASKEAGSKQVTRSVEQLIKMTGTSKIPVQVWIGEDGLVRRERLDFKLRQQGQAGRVAMTIDFLKFGVEVKAGAPPASQTTDLTELLQRGLASG